MERRRKWRVTELKDNTGLLEGLSCLLLIRTDNLQPQNQNQNKYLLRNACLHACMHECLQSVGGDDQCRSGGNDEGSQIALLVHLTNNYY
jgi:hypothetical protein